MHTPTRLGILAVLILAGGLFAPAIDNGFRDDDFVFLAQAEAASWSTLLRPSTDFTFYRPGALLVFWLEHTLFGLWGGGYLLFNLGLHLVNAVLFRQVLRRLGLSEPVCLLAAGLFLLGLGHYSRQLLWACTSGPLISVTCGLVALWVTLGLWSAGSRAAGSRTGSRLAVLLSLGFGVTCHEAALVYPVLLMPWTRGLRGRLLLFVPAAAWLATLALRADSHPAYLESLPRLLAAPVYWFRYPGFMLLPIQPSQLAIALPLQITLATAILLASLVAWDRAGTPIRFLILWLYASLLPFCLVELPGWFLEMRYLYAASMPFCALTVTSLSAFAPRARTMRRRLAMAALAVQLTACIAMQVWFEQRYDEIARSGRNARRFEEMRATSDGSRHLERRSAAVDDERDAGATAREGWSR